MLEPAAPRFAVGHEVRLRSRPDRAGRIEKDPIRVQGEYWYTVYFGPGRTGRHPESDLETYEGSLDDVIGRLRGGLLGGREAFTKLLCHLRLSKALQSQIYSLAASRTTFYAYQFKPVLKFLESRRHRLLIADEVGLGKTIEAGLILTELRKRRPLKRVLIVPPSHLIPKWRDEMRNRFDLQFDIFDSRRLLDFLRTYEREGDETPLRAIVSLQTLRGIRVLEQWESVEPPLDIVIFDEAGRLRNASTRSHSVAEIVSANADAVLFLTATPVQTSDEDLFNLLHLLEPDEFGSYDVFRERLQVNRYVLETLRLLARRGRGPEQALETLRKVEQTSLARWFSGNPLYLDVLERLRALHEPTRRDLIELQRDVNGLGILAHIVSRTRKAEAHQDRPVRRARVVRAEATPAEREFYDKVTETCRAAYARSSGNTLAAFATMMPQRQVASSMVAMIDYCLERQRSREEDIGPEDSDLIPEDFEVDDTKPRGSGIDWGGLGDLQAWRTRLAKHDSKWETLKTKVLDVLAREEPKGKVIIYAFFKRTLFYLEERLKQAGIRTVVITGDVPSVPDDPEKDERGKRLDLFRDDPSVKILLSTEVGDEGLDLQFAHILVNYDLPWNPMRVEQRIGRVDRIGQRSDHISIINLSMPGTIEDRMLERLYMRIRIFEESIGDLESILGEEVRHLSAELFSRTLSPEEQERRIEQTADVIERHQIELKQWERDADVLIGHDEFFLDEIDHARQRHRYVGGPELLVYVRDFLAANHAACSLGDGGAAETYRLIVDDDLRGRLRAAIPADDLGLRQFLQRSGRGEVVFTTDPEVAQTNRRLEFLTFYHPLVRTVNQFYDENPRELYTVSHVRVETPEVSAGRYVWFLYLIELTGARPIRDLECVAVSLDSGEVCGSDEGEILLSEMLRQAESVPSGQRYGGVTDDMPQRAEETLISRLDARYTERQRYNDALVTNRLSSMEETFGRTVMVKEQRIDAAKSRGRQATYVRGLETGLRNVKEAHRVKIREIEAGRLLGRSFQLRGAGVVEVTNNGRVAN